MTKWDDEESLGPVLSIKYAWKWLEWGDGETGRRGDGGRRGRRGGGGEGRGGRGGGEGEGEGEGGGRRGDGETERRRGGETERQRGGTDCSRAWHAPNSLGSHARGWQGGTDCSRAPRPLSLRLPHFVVGSVPCAGAIRAEPDNRLNPMHGLRWEHRWGRHRRHGPGATAAGTGPGATVGCRLSCSRGGRRLSGWRSWTREAFRGVRHPARWSNELTSVQPLLARR